MAREIVLNKYRNVGICAHVDAGKQQQQKEFFFTQVYLTRLVRFMMVQL